MNCLSLMLVVHMQYKELLLRNGPQNARRTRWSIKSKLWRWESLELRLEGGLVVVVNCKSSSHTLCNCISHTWFCFYCASCKSWFIIGNLTTHWTSNNTIAIMQHFNINVLVSPFCFTQFGFFVCWVCTCVNWKLKFQNQEFKQLCVIFVWCLSVKNLNFWCKILGFTFLLKVHSFRF